MYFLSVNWIWVVHQISPIYKLMYSELTIMLPLILKVFMRSTIFLIIIIIYKAPGPFQEWSQVLLKFLIYLWKNWDILECIAQLVIHSRGVVLLSQMPYIMTLVTLKLHYVILKSFYNCIASLSGSSFNKLVSLWWLHKVSSSAYLYTLNITQ